MARNIRIKSGLIEITAELNQLRTAQMIWNALPIKATAETWGDEIYFSIPVHLELENGKEVVSVGDLGYWPPGDAFCIFFGLTPLSQNNQIRPASAVTVFGKIIGDTGLLRKVKSGAEIVITKDK
jgi:uncharacterized protein